MSAAFTPGPWCVGVDDYGDVVVDRAGDENRICTVGRNAQGSASAVANFGHFDTPEVRADAALIAAAPELYEALDAIMTHHEGFFVSTFELELAARARDALAEARGESPHNQSNPKVGA